MVKLLPKNPVYTLATVYMLAVQERFHFLKVLHHLHGQQTEGVALIYMPKKCIYMPKPSCGDHYTLLPLAGGKDICTGSLSEFVAAKLTVASKYGGNGMGVFLKLPPSFGLQLDGSELITKPALCRGPIWKTQTLWYATAVSGCYLWTGTLWQWSPPSRWQALNYSLHPIVLP